MDSLPQMHVTVTVSNPPKPRQLYQIGWNRYMDGLPLSSCENDHERRGWNAANRADAECSTSGYAESMGW